MAYTTNQLITDAYYTAGIVSREFETASGSQIADGLQALNEVISKLRLNDGMIPYETTYHLKSVIGQEKYFIPNLIQIDTLTFFLDKVRYPMAFSKRNQYFGSGRVENIDSLPFEWYFERQVGGGNLYIYFKPDKNYPIEIHGIFNLEEVSLNQDLLLNVTTSNLGAPKFYGLGALNPGQFVVNDFDLIGPYTNIGALANYINSGIIPGVKASMVVNDFVLSSTTKPPVPIYISTNGYSPNGTKSVGNASTISLTNLSASYNNGSQGAGATLTALSPGVLSLSGYAVQLNDRVLINSQTDAAENGIYSLTTVGTVSVPYVLTRANGYNKSINIGVGDLVTITNGIFAGATFVQTSQVTTIGLTLIKFLPFDALTFSNFSTIEDEDYQIFNPQGLDKCFINYFIYATSKILCTKYNYVTPENVITELREYESLINKKSRVIDLQMQKVSTLQKRGTFNWAFINLGKGWQRPG